MKKVNYLIAYILFNQFVFSQDTCNTAQLITAGFHTVTVVNGTGIPNPVCTPGGVVATAGEWYRYVSTQNRTITVTTDIVQNTPRVDTRVHIYGGVCAGLNCYANNDDVDSSNNVASSVTFNAFANITYYIAFDNRWVNTGFTFQLIESPFVASNDPVTFNAQTINNLNVSSTSTNYKRCVVDMDGDYLDDLVTVAANAIRVNKQNSNGNGFTFTDYPTTTAQFPPNVGLAAGDYNNDGFNDLFYANGSGSSFAKSQNGSGYSITSYSQYVFCQRNNFIDLNNDGHLDAFTCNDTASNVYFLNDGNSNLTFYQSGITPGAANLGILPGGNYGSTFVDYDNDGDQDLFISKCTGTFINEMHRNDSFVSNGNAIVSFSDVSFASNLADPVQSWTGAWADYDNDGDMDVVVGASSPVNGSHKYMRNNGNGTFTDATVGSGWDTFTTLNINYSTHDFDNNGFCDVIAGGYKIMYNQGNAIFAPTSVPFGPSPVGDLNNDGFLDFFNSQANSIYFNGGNSNNWIKINLQGIQSNRNGIGARVEIYGAWGKQIRDVRSGDGFSYMSTLNTHFGIGTANNIEQLVIKWPSGIVDTIINPTINQAILVVEGSTLSTDSFSATTFSVSPIPAKDTINIKSNTGSTLVSAEIYDLNGRKILDSKIENETINVQSLPSGAYIILVNDANGQRTTQKFTKE